MRKIVLILAVTLMLLASITLIGCSCKADIPSGSTTYVLESIEPNNVGVTMGSISEFTISLNTDYNTYVVLFKAQGMPVYTTEVGTYGINGSSITFTKSDGGTIISEGLNFNSKDGTITVACLQRGSAETYTAVFKKSLTSTS